MSIDQRRDGDRWKMRKEISLGDVIGILAAGAAVLASYYKLDTRITVLESVRTELSYRLDRIENKLDRVIEKR